MALAPDPPAAKRLVAERLRARRRRVAVIRKRVLAGSAATFVLAWGVIFVQLVSGHDPVLSKKTAASSASTSQRSSSGSSSTGGSSTSGSSTSGSSTSGSSTSGASTGSTSTGSPNSSAGSGSGSTGAVTTSQS